MHLSLSTFLIEIANFFILLWILWRFLLGPIQRVVADRKSAVRTMLEEANREKSQALAQQAAYEERQKEWNQEKETARVAFVRSLEEERVKKEAELSRSLDSERERFAARQAQEAAEEREKIELKAMSQALTFVSRLLADLSSPDLESRLIDLFIKEVTSPGGELLAVLEKNPTDIRTVTVWSAYPLTPERQSALTKSLAIALKRELSVTYSVDQTLVAGLRIDMGGILFCANIRDELNAFNGKRRA